MLHATVALSMLCLAAGIDRDVPARVIQREIRCRVLLIDFAGRERVHPRESFEKVLFGTNVRATPDRFRQPMCGSVRDWFDEISDGRLRVTGQVNPWVRSRHKLEDLPHWHTTRDGNRDWWQPVAADAMSLNKIPKDDRIDGKPVDFYIIIYAGPPFGYLKCLGKSTFLGAGRRGFSDRVFGGGKVPYWEDHWNGKQLIFCPERWELKESGLYGMGIFCHELGHAFCGFWDLYTPSGGNFGRWGVMGLGDKTHFPAGPIALHRYMAGWLSYDVPQQRGRHHITLPPLQAKRAIKLVNGPLPWADSLIVEYRVRTGPNDRNLPAEGLLVYEAYGRRRVRTVSWNEKTGKPTVTEQRLRLLRADGTSRNEAGDAFRHGKLTMFGTPSAASSATGCGYWELTNIREPKDPEKPPFSAADRQPATFDATYCPRHVVVRRPDAPVHLGRWLPPGDYRLCVQVAKGTCTVQSDKTLLEVPEVTGVQPRWGLVDVHVADDRQRLSIVPGTNSQLSAAQVVARKPVRLNLLAEPYAAPLASGFDGQITASAGLGSSVWVGGAATIPLGKSKRAVATVPLTCPGGTLRLAVRAFARRGQSAPQITLVAHDGDKRQKYLTRVALDATRPEFFLVDCDHLRGKPIRLELAFDGPTDSRVTLWEAAFTAN